jgi:hypothetical protein
VRQGQQGRKDQPGPPGHRALQAPRDQPVRPDLLALPPRLLSTPW